MPTDFGRPRVRFCLESAVNPEKLGRLAKNWQLAIFGRSWPFLGQNCIASQIWDEGVDHDALERNILSTRTKPNWVGGRECGGGVVVSRMYDLAHILRFYL